MARTEKPQAPAAALDTAPPEAPAAALDAVSLVAMVRDEPLHVGGPVTADVHPDEVDGMIAAGWLRAE